MKKSDGKEIKYKIAVFISGKGSNLKSIIKHSSKKKSYYSVELVISNTPKAKGLLIAKKKGIRSYVIDLTKNKKLGKLALQILKKNKIKLVCLAGFMKILPAHFIKLYYGKIINIHPSLLPKYKGMNAIKQAIEDSAEYTGVTIHYVDVGMDSGYIIKQERIKINENDTVETLKDRLQEIEHRLYFDIIKFILNKNKKIKV